MKVLPESFYLRNSVTTIAKQLVGKLLYTHSKGHITSGLIVETEAYSFREHGCHAYQSRMTRRNQIMFGPGGHTYVYVCYGMHHLLNVVTNQAQQAEAVLIRALQPVEGIQVMLDRVNTDTVKRITSGPGKLTKALGIDRTWNGKQLLGTEIWIEEGEKLNTRHLMATTRVGIDYAGEDANLPWRFYWKDNPWVSKV